MNGSHLALGLVSALALAGAVRRRGSRSTADTVWFHGRTARSTRFDLERVGDRYATNQEGPGFYFTTDPDEARGYAHPSGVVLRATLHVPRWVSTTAPPKRAEVERLMRASPAYEDVLTDWDESSQRAHQKALSAMLNAKSQRDAFLNVWGDFYRRADENPAYLRALVKLGYGGVHVPNPHGAPHAVVFSPDFIENVALVDDLGTGPVGSTNARRNTFGPRLPLGVGTLAYRVKRDTNDNLLLAVYSGPTRIAHMDAYWEYSMRGAEDRQEDVEKRGRGLACAKDLRALGAEGKYPNLLAVHHAFLDDASWKGKGVGRAMYEALFREAFAVRERRIGGAKGPLFAMPHACTTAGNTSDDALRVWQSLAKRYPSSGVVVRFDAEPARGSAARTAPPKHVPVERFWTISSKLEETLQDVAEGRRSYSYDEPLRVSALDTPRGHYFVLDGHHRLVEHLQAGDRTVAIELDPYTPRIERTGGAHHNMVAQKVNIAARVRRGSASLEAWPNADALARTFTGTMANATAQQMGRWAKKNGLVYIGSGQSRAVFAEPDGTRVLKLVFSFFGREANRDEARAWREASAAMRPHLVPVLAADPMGSWLVMERVKPLRATQHIPKETMDALKGCGFLDLRRPNFAADGRLLDYGAMLFWKQDARCRAEGSAARPTQRTDPALWEAVKAEVTASDTGGRPGQWSARKAQRSVQLYKERGGGYLGPKDPDNALSRWTKQDWRTRSGGESLQTGERYLPDAAFDLLTPAEVGATTRAKRAGLARGQQFTPQPANIARKTKKAREGAANVIAPSGYDQTAMARTGPSAPVQHLRAHAPALLRGRLLDFGSGRGADAKALRATPYDPHHPDAAVRKRPTGTFDTVLAVYVLNVLPKAERHAALRAAAAYVKPGGHLVLAVRPQADVAATVTDWSRNGDGHQLVGEDGARDRFQRGYTPDQLAREVRAVLGDTFAPVPLPALPGSVVGAWRRA